MKKDKKLTLEIYSDIHLEFGDFNYKDNPKSDVVIFAGDLGVGLQGINWIKENIKNKPVIYVAGNHEFYGQEIKSTYKKIKKATKGTNIHFLQNEKVTINGVNFLGCTLWTDFNLHGKQEFAMGYAPMFMNDYNMIEYKISGQKNPLTAKYILDQHNESLEFLSKNISKGDVVITHHAPSIKSINKMYSQSTRNQYYATNLDEFILDKNPCLWVHGHCHTKNNYKIGNTNVVSNPRGYVGHEIYGCDFKGVFTQVKPTQN